MPEDFLLITGEDWTELVGIAPHIENNIGLQTLQNMIADQDWTGIKTAMGDVWQPPEGFDLVDARVISNGGLRMWAKLAAV